MSVFVFLLLGFVFLFFGGDFLVRGSVSIALKLKISTLVVGMTVVAFATSAPELFVSLQAIFMQSSNIALGNAIGSNIANIALVLALTALLFRVRVLEKSLSLSYLMMLGSSIILGLVLYFFNGIPNVVGFFFVLLLFIFLWFLISSSRKEYLAAEDKDNKLFKLANSDTLFKSLGLLLLGVVLLKYGADFLVDSATIMAKSFGVSDRVIAVTILAIGTSVPELATSIVAALKKEENIAVGNLIGSNIFNILAVLGITACVQEIKIDDDAILYFDYLWMVVITLLLGLFIYVFSNKYFSTKEGGVFFLIYLVYIYNILF